MPAILFFIVWIQALFLDPDIFSEEPGDIPFYIFTIISFFIIALSLFMWLKIGLKLHYVELNDESITLYKSNGIVTYNWNQVEYIKKVIFTIPVSYKFKIRGSEDFFMTCSTPMLPAPFHIFDTTPFGKFIKIKKAQNNI
jgi:hypothetical protein